MKDQKTNARQEDSLGGEIAFLRRRVAELEEQQTLRESQEQFQALVAASAQIVWTTDTNGVVTEDSPSWRAFTGQSYNEYQGFGWLEALHPEDRKRVARVWDESVRAATPMLSEYRLRHISGEWRWTTARGVPLFHPDGAVRGWVGMNTDVTDRKLAEAQEREGQLQALADSLPQLVWMADAEGSVFWYNRRWYEYTGTTPKEMQGWGWQSAHDPEILPSVLERWQNSIAAGKAFEMEFPLRGADGVFRWFLTRVIPVRDSAGAITHWYGTNTDVDALRRAKDALGVSEARFRTAVQAMSGILWTNNARGAMEGEQPGWSAFTGQTYEEYQGYGWSKAVHPEDAQPTVDEWNRTVAERRMFVFEHRVRRHDGKWRRCSIRALPILDAEGAIREWVGIHTDVTDERNLLDAVRASEQRLRIVTDNAKVGLVVVSREHRYIFANQKYADILSLPSSDITGLRVADVLAPVYEKQILPRLERAFAGETVTYELMVPPQGEHGERRYSVIYEPSTDEEGAPVVVVVIFEITERVRAEQALLASETRFRQLADAMPQIVWTARPDGYIDYYNERWYELTGIDRNRFGNSSWEPILHPDDVRPVYQRWCQSVETGQPFQMQLRFFDRRILTYRWHLGRAVAVRDGEGRIIRWFGTSTDINDQKQTEEALRRSNQDLEQFAYAASHDLQEPLRMVATYTQMLARKYQSKLDPQADQFIAYAVEGAKRMGKLLDGLLQYSRAGTPVENTAVTDSAAVLGETLENLRMAIRESGAVITNGPLPPVRIPAVHLLELFQNLLGNSIKYRGEASPRIHVSARPDGKWICFEIADNGIGIKPEYSQHIFGVFRRLHGERYDGTGIGLAICKRITEHYGGRIWVHSELGKGASFYFTVPALEIE